MLVEALSRSKTALDHFQLVGGFAGKQAESEGRTFEKIMAGPLFLLLAATTSFHGAPMSPRSALPVRRTVVSQLQSSKMIDQNMLVGGTVALMGSLGGIVRARARRRATRHAG